MQKDFPAEYFKIIEAAIRAVEPERIIQDCVRIGERKIIFGNHQIADPEKFDNIYVVGAGKASVGMLRGLYKVLGDQISGGLIITKHLLDESEHIGKVHILRGNHPIPGIESMNSSQALVDFTQCVTEKDLVICLISGGGSALMSLPTEDLSQADVQATTEFLLSSGAAIHELNTVRKHLDRIKGGGLARLLYPAQIVTLILSDVIGNPLEIIASGPTIADDSTYMDTRDILERYDPAGEIPEAVRRHIQKGINGEYPETVKPGSDYLLNLKNLVIGDNMKACQAAIQKSRQLGLNSLLLTTSLQGEARDAGAFLAAILRETAISGHPIPRPACIIAGGETTVHVRGKGLGGRNHEMALGSVKELSGLNNVGMIPFATDGDDGQTNAAGAIVTGKTLQKGLESSMNVETFMANNDSGSYFSCLEDSIITGPTGTNVNDICFMFAW